MSCNFFPAKKWSYVDLYQANVFQVSPHTSQSSPRTTTTNPTIIQPSILTMSRPDFTPHPYPIDPEWAASLVGLRLIVPNSWWPDYHDDGLNLGCIVAIDYDAMGTGFFQLQLDGEDYTYGMNYDSILLYADSKQPGYAGYRLPHHCPANPDIEMVQVP